ncbi:glucose-dependent insulinotropic receptor-like [Limulus polyphemus]|uniref:Glucose-dependent insulinotropic receptor-like n=1 Tax=Limulus polyphemus TaxID=6850 RepID=A0ABM1SL71_LIMPO|nr:glucose-dependent insulinotropic receptor-like [Limulus polyphemus]XP_022244377.1 glucose-dependent insulinotropic receptor-like [Limulus polyphemus]
MDPSKFNASKSTYTRNFELTSPFEDGLAMNVTDIPSNQKAQLLVYDILVPIIGAVIVLANSAVVISSGLLLKKGVTPKSTYLFLGNLALSDVLTGITVLVGHFYPDSIRTQTCCLIQLGSIVSASLASSWSITLIGIDRFIFIAYGLYYNNWMTTKRARLMICFLWIICILIGFSPAMGWSFPVDGSQCWYVIVATPEHLLFTVIIGIFLPLGVIAVLYTFILYKAIRQVSIRKGSTLDKPPENIHMFEIQGQKKSKSVLSKIYYSRGQRHIFTTGCQNQERKSQKKWKAIKVVIFTLSAFVVSWFPYFIAVIIYAIDPNMQLAVTMATVLAVLGFLNSLLNPLIYAWWHRGLRKFITEDCLCRKKKRESYRLGAFNSKNNTPSTSNSKFSSSSPKSSVGENQVSGTKQV